MKQELKEILKDFIELMLCAGERLGEITELILDKFIEAILYAIDILLDIDRKGKHYRKRSEDVKIKVKRLIGMIIPYKPKH